MTISEAKLEANRKNARRSTGPQTAQGKDRSRRNAVKHGLRAESLLMLDEDPQELEDRKEAWRTCLAPRDLVELSIVDDAVEYSWMLDRARRAQVSRLATNIASAGIDQAIREADRVLCLGQKLFADNRAPLADYPHSDVGSGYSNTRISYSELLDDPEDPPRLVLHLQATAGGCQWMLDRWAELRSILEDGLNWQSVDKLKAVRLLGRQPLEAVDDRNVLLIFIACQRMEGQPIDTIPEIWKELGISEKKRYAERLRGRGVDRLVPEDPAAALQLLFGLIDHATAQIKVKAEEHRRRAEIVDALAAECLLFDDSPEGERLRRYELANGRAKARALNELRMRQRSHLPAVTGQLSVVGGSAEAKSEPIAPNEPTAICENAPNEPTAICENAPNEPTECWENAPNEPTDDWENAPNEPTVAAVGEAGNLREWTVGVSDEHEAEVGLGAPMDAGGALEAVAAEEPLESVEDAIKSITQRRQEHTRRLNEEARKEATGARAARSAHPTSLSPLRSTTNKPRKTDHNPALVASNPVTP
jgi:hypothetical protein